MNAERKKDGLWPTSIGRVLEPQLRLGLWHLLPLKSESKRLDTGDNDESPECFYK